MTNYQSTEEERTTRWHNRNERNGHIWTGLFLVLVGSVALAKAMLVPIPWWLFTWQTFLITLGIFIGVRGNFHGAAWLILITIGGAFLLNDFYPALELRSRFWPLIIIVLGAIFILRPHNRRRNQQWRARFDDQDIITSNENVIDVTTVFGSTQKTITSKQFTGGDITCMFGGSEIDLTNADIQGQVMIDVTAICGGVELIVPAHWVIKSDVASLFGSVRDKREQVAPSLQDAEKVIVLDGTALFGGIEIRSFRK